MVVSLCTSHTDRMRLHASIWPVSVLLPLSAGHINVSVLPEELQPRLLLGTNEFVSLVSYFYRATVCYHSVWQLC